MVDPESVQVRIEPRRNAQGHPFTEVFYDFIEDGVPRNALTRVWFVLSDSPHARASERQAFLRRQAMPLGV